MPTPLRRRALAAVVSACVLGATPAVLGTTTASAAVPARPAAWIRSTAWPSHEPSAARVAASSRPRCTCSAVLARLK